MTDKADENWLPIKDYEGLYEVSDMGNIRSLDARGKARRILKLSVRKDGYMRACLIKDRIPKTFYVHRIVVQAFVGSPDGLLTNHKNGVRNDNRAENLEIVSYRENTSHANLRRTNKKIGATQKKDGRWCSYINFAGKVRFLGYYPNEQLAHEAYKQALKDRNLENKYA